MKLEKGTCKLVLESGGRSLELDINRIQPVLLDLERDESRDLMIARLTVDDSGALNLICLSERDARALAEEIAEGLLKTVQ